VRPRGKGGGGRRLLPRVHQGAWPTNERDPWLTEKEAAKELRVSVYTVRMEREAGRLGYARLRCRVFYAMSMINAYKASPMRPVNSAPDGAALLGSSPSLRAAARGFELARKLKPHERPSTARKSRDGSK
jgi:hypothetical protein